MSGKLKPWQKEQIKKERTERFLGQQREKKFSSEWIVQFPFEPKIIEMSIPKKDFVVKYRVYVLSRIRLILNNFWNLESISRKNVDFKVLYEDEK